MTPFLPAWLGARIALRDGCWSPVRSSGAGPPGADALDVNGACGGPGCAGRDRCCLGWPDVSKGLTQRHAHTPPSRRVRRAGLEEAAWKAEDHRPDRLPRLTAGPPLRTSTFTSPLTHPDVIVTAALSQDCDRAGTRRRQLAGNVQVMTKSTHLPALPRPHHHPRPEWLLPFRWRRLLVAGPESGDPGRLGHQQHRRWCQGLGLRPGDRNGRH